MEERNVIKWNRRFNLCKWLFIAVSILSLMSIVYALATGEVSVFSFVIKNMEVITYSLVMAWMCGRITVKCE